MRSGVAAWKRAKRSRRARPASACVELTRARPRPARGRELRPPADDPAGDPGGLRRTHDGFEPLGRGVGDRDEDFLRARARDRPLHLVRAPDHGDPEDTPPAHARVVVEEPDHAGLLTLPQLASEAPPGGSGADDQDSPPMPSMPLQLREEPEGQPGCPDEERREDRVDDEDLDGGERPDRAQRHEDEVGDDRRRRAPDRDRDDVARGREPPHPAVHAEGDEEDVARGEQDRQRGEEDRALVLRPRSADDEEVGGEEGAADDQEVDDDLDEPARLEDERPPERRLGRLGGAAARERLEIAQEAPELDEQDEGDEHAERGQPPVVEDVVRERGRADRRGDEREQEHRLRLGEPVVERACARCGSRPPCVTGLRSASRLSVTSVVSRIGTARTSRGGGSSAVVVPATVPARSEARARASNPSTWPGVAHEHRRAAAGDGG